LASIADRGIHITHREQASFLHNVSLGSPFPRCHAFPIERPAIWHTLSLNNTFIPSTLARLKRLWPLCRHGSGSPIRRSIGCANCSDRSTNNPVGQQKSTCWLTNRPVSIWPAHCPAYVRLHCLVNGLPHWATGHLVRQQAGP